MAIKLDLETFQYQRRQIQLNYEADVVVLLCPWEIVNAIPPARLIRGIIPATSRFTFTVRLCDRKQ